MLKNTYLTFGLGSALTIAVSAANYAQETLSSAAGATTLAERTVPLPAGLSREMLEVVQERQIGPIFPAPETSQEWLELQSSFDAPGEAQGRKGAEHNGATYEIRQIGGVRTYSVTPRRIHPGFADRVFVHTHGGAWVFGGGDSVLREAVWLASGVGVKVVSIDYRRPPLHPFPAAIEDAVAVWREVIKDQNAAGTALFGTSAGGNIALATTLKLKELGEPLPGAVFAGTPATDLASISDSWYTMVGLDPLGPRKGIIAGAFELYIGQSDPANPLLSPVNGDLRGFPPTILITGTRDLLLSDTVRMHRALRKAGVAADLHVYDAQTHADYMQNLTRPIPECEDAQVELTRFFEKHLESND